MLKPLDWARRRLFNKKALKAAPDSSKILAAAQPYQEPNRASLRDWLFGTRAGRQGRRARYRAWQRSLRSPRPDYPILSHCFIGKCRKLPRYNGRCYSHAFYENTP
jgi:hypothetical protein